MYVWIYVCIYVCMYACMHVCMYAYVCTHVRMYACTYVHMYVFMNVCVNIYIYTHVSYRRVVTRPSIGMAIWYNDKTTHDNEKQQKQTIIWYSKTNNDKQMGNNPNDVLLI